MKDDLATAPYRAAADPSAWSGRELGGVDAIRYRLNESEIDAFESIVIRTRANAPQLATREDFDHPALNGLYAELRSRIMDGRGAVVIGGLSPARFTAEEFERIFWGIGTHLGVAAVQSTAGDRIGHVRVEDNPKNRGYLSSRELGFHSDAFELMGLMCVQQAASGGLTRLASGLAVHNAMLEERPDLLPSLYEGYYYATAEAAGAQRPVTPYKIPVFSSVGGKLSCMCLKAYMSAAAKRLDTELPPDLDEALRLFLAIAERDDIKLEFMLHSGEILLCNNFTIVHARTPFENSETLKRHMLRLWLKVPNGRPVVRPLLERGVEYERIYSQVLAE